MNTIINWFRKPFPLVESTRERLLIALGSAVVVFGILILFRPFGIKSGRDTFFFLSGFGLIDFVVTALNLFLLPLIIPQIFNSSRFTTGKNFLVILWILLMISLVNYLYGEYMINALESIEKQHNTGLLSWMGMTFSVGVIPVIFALYYIEKRLYWRNFNWAEDLNKETKNPKTRETQKQIQLKSSKNISISINADDLICIKAEGGNYASVFWMDESGTKSEMIRMTLAGFLDDAGDLDSLVRCHKSYIVNLDKVQSYRGNARSVIIQLEGVDFEVPVSRSFPREKLTKTN